MKRHHLHALLLSRVRETRRFIQVLAGPRKVGNPAVVKHPNFAKNAYLTAISIHLALASLPVTAGGFHAQRNDATYKGWKSYCLGNGLIELQVLPEIGGRIIQYKLGDKEFLWVNPQLVGKLPPATGLTEDGGWFNAGGDKLWPAPQGWDNEQQWPGPPDAVLDGQPYRLEKLPCDTSQTAIRLTSAEDPRSGIRFSRVVRMFSASTRVSFEATMENIDTKPRRWGIWAHTQLDGTKADGSGPNPLMNAWCPLNPQSRFASGYHVIFGDKNNPSFQPDPACGLMRVNYQYKVGKIGLDSRAGWSATVDGQNGAVFAQRFTFEPGKEYPDGSSVEFWLNGTGRIHAYNKDMVMSDKIAENPCVFESEILSPFAELSPGQSYTWRYDWYACNIGGDFPVVDCSAAGVVSVPLSAEWSAGKVRLKGRFGVFASGKVIATFTDAQGQQLQAQDSPIEVTPLKPLVLDSAVDAPNNATSVRLVLTDNNGKAAGDLAKADLKKPEAATRWPADKARQWYDKQPWLVGCNFLPSTAVNDVEMWQAESFDPQTIDRELGWAQDLGFNTVRVFLNYAVWEADAPALKENLRRFLTIADRHGITTLVILLDDCFNPEPRVGRQPDPVPGVHNSQWVQSPGVKRRNDRAAWPKLEEYVKDMVGAFASDKRVLAWDLYNEPIQESLPLVEACFRWAREAGPQQPLTTCVSGGSADPKRLAELSDIISFHNYGDLTNMRAQTDGLLAGGRPLFCTEWMARGTGSRFETHLPYFKEHKIGCWNWGLVAGRTQTYYPWGSPKDAPEPKLWHHDILRRDGTPFNVREVRFIKVATGRLPASALPQTVALAPTAEKAPAQWRYMLDKPADGWFKPEFDDSAWKQGAAPFGTAEPAIARKPNTEWRGSDIWLRREFAMPAGRFTDLALSMHHDEDATVYINGVLAVTAGGYNAAYESFDITPEAQAALKPGRNVIAVHCHQTTGGQYLDAGLEGVEVKQP